MNVSLSVLRLFPSVAVLVGAENRVSKPWEP